jgi:hypothetical protein
MKMETMKEEEVKRICCGAARTERFSAVAKRIYHYFASDIREGKKVFSEFTSDFNFINRQNRTESCRKSGKTLGATAPRNSRSGYIQYIHVWIEEE